MRREAGIAETVDRKVVEAHQLEAGLGQIKRRILGEVDVILLVARLQQLARHPRLQEHAQVVTQVERLEVGPLDALAGQDLHDACLSHQDLERQGVDRGTAGHEMGRRVHVGAAVRGEVQARQAVGRVTGSLNLFDRERWVARIDGQPRDERYRDVVDPGHGASSQVGGPL